MATPLTDAELEALLADIESDRVERKAAWAGDAPEKARQAVCAFANDLPGHGQPGVLFIGAHNDGSASGTAITDQLLQTLADLRSDGKTVPPPSLTVEKLTLRGAPMAVVTVQPADAPPVRYEGRIWIRARGEASRTRRTSASSTRSAATATSPSIRIRSAAARSPN